VTYVDWCDAYAYCLGAGKRLCGKIGGGPNTYTDFSNAGFSQWYYVCSFNGMRKFPYGNIYDPSRCNTYLSSNVDSHTDVRAKSNCQSGFPGIYDLSGNVAEWEDSCEGLGMHQYCRVRGGSSSPDLDYEYTSCGTVDYGSNRSTTDRNYGFRCCI
jgi:formylglycine-generating enzyme required for sulfatase activity